MDNLEPQKTTPPPGRLVSFFKKYYLLLIALGLILFFFYILFLSATASTPSSQNITTKNLQTTPTLNEPSLMPTQSKKETISKFIAGTTLSQSRFSEIDFSGIPVTKTPQADGSTKYTYISLDTKRPNELIVKDDIVIYHRDAVSQKYVYNYTQVLGTPDYTFVGSRYYGPNTITYVYLKKGTAFVADSNTTLLHEQLIFQPMTLEEFKKKYGTDITNYTIIPTLPAE